MATCRNSEFFKTTATSNALPQITFCTVCKDSFYLESGDVHSKTLFVVAYFVVAVVLSILFLYEMFTSISILFIIFSECLADSDTAVNKKPTVFIAIFARNKEITLPFFLSLLQDQDYPKDRISLWVKTDHNVDNTPLILEKWVEVVKDMYHSVNLIVDNSETEFPEETGPAHWSDERFKHMIALREEALTVAREKWADFIFFLDCDVFLLNNQTFNYLVQQNMTVTAPMLKSIGMYSNFWCGMTEKYYYLRTDDYTPILKRERKGCFNVPMIHSAVLINLRRAKSDYLTFNSSKVRDYTGPDDDIIAFAISANRSGIGLYLCNEVPFGYIMLPLESKEPLHYDAMTLSNLKVEILVENPPLTAKGMFSPYLANVTADKMGFDNIYMINLKRRPERRYRMVESFKELGMDVTVLDAVDGRNLDDEYIRNMGIEFMQEYKDPYHKRAMTHGEIGCFLSHYFIWKKVVEDGDNVIMVLEDDIQFEPYFRQKVTALLEEVEQLQLPWDLIYLGRKRLVDDESWVKGSKSLVHVAYSYWTLGYLLTNRGARKLLEPEPLKKLIPVDEYIPILFDKHPEETWKKHFPKRDLVAYSVAPLLLYPTHYTGEEGYISDTENSQIIQEATPHVREDL